MKKLYFFIVFFLSSFVYAGPLYLMAGGGLNTSTYWDNKMEPKTSTGLHLKTDLGYFFNDNWAFEGSSLLKINRISRTFIWDTPMTIGTRYKLKKSSHYFRLFLGKSPTVIYRNRFDSSKEKRDASRIHYDGTIYGMAVGKFFVSRNKNVWFLELGSTFQSLTKETGIRNNGHIPDETYKRRPDHPIHIFSFTASIGIQVF